MKLIAQVTLTTPTGDIAPGGELDIKDKTEAESLISRGFAKAAPGKTKASGDAEAAAKAEAEAQAKATAESEAKAAAEAAEKAAAENGSETSPPVA